MIFFFYSVGLFFFSILFAPFHLIRLILSSKYRESTPARMGFQGIPEYPAGTKTYWIHSVSVGETQAAGILAAEMKRQRPNIKICVSTITETGQAVARKLDSVDDCFYFPLDFGFLSSNILEKIQPTAVFIIETDLWPGFIHQIDKRKIPLYLINGKLSANSLKNYQRLSLLSQQLLKPFSQFFVQTEIYKERFIDAGVPEEKLNISGNIKLDTEIPVVSDNEKQELLKTMRFDVEKPIIVFGSSHLGEEEICIETYKKLQDKFPGIQCVLVPRHPERFESVVQLLIKKNIRFQSFSKLDTASEGKISFVLVDAMGLLVKLYSISTLCIVAGSFTGKVGGHNILEPGYYKKPVIYGPFIYSQPGFHQIVQDFHAGVQVDEKGLAAAAEDLLRNPQKAQELGDSAFCVVEKMKGATERIVTNIFSLNSV